MGLGEKSGARQRRARGIPREHRRSDPEARGTYRKPPLFPVEENLCRRLRMKRDGKLATCEFPGRAAHMRRLRSGGSGGCVAVQQATRCRTPRKKGGRRGPGVRTSRRRARGIHRTARSKGPPCAPITHHTQPKTQRMKRRRYCRIFGHRVSRFCRRSSLTTRKAA